MEENKTKKESNMNRSCCKCFNLLKLCLICILFLVVGFFIGYSCAKKSCSVNYHKNNIKNHFSSCKKSLKLNDVRDIKDHSSCKKCLKSHKVKKD